ncbi:Sec-independent protein translocase subunit TatA [Actinomadura hibisca]|uniref:Sec-independent protein translocase subunit TatA n=1 Tax=Actinomadura hibisca TaxID=68565 RepID=UPI00083772F7|nr:Sec-independent protein translocase subunit TatA [Actinomadura hibisca]
MGSFGTSEILIVLLVVLLLFGSTKLPQLARSLGKSARILKAETKGLRDDDDDAPADTPADRAAGRDADRVQAQEARDRAAQLREEAARLEREAANVQPGAQPGAQQQPYRQGALPSGEPIQGVPVADRDRFGKS